MGINFGTAHVDKAFLDELVAVGVKESDATELARMDTFGGCSVGGWIAGLKAAATLMNKGGVTLDWGTLPVPWDTIGPALLSMNGAGPVQALLSAIGSYSVELQSALLSAIGTVAAQIDAVATASHVTNIVSPAPSVISGAQMAAQYMQPVDPKLIRVIQATLARHGNKEQQRKKAGELLIDWLVQNGRLIRTPYGQKYYLHRSTHRLYAFDTNAWHGWLYRLTNCNPASQHFRYLLADCETAADDGDQMDVVRVTHWDMDEQILRVSRFDGTVYRLDGNTIEEEANGDGPVLFEDDMSWLPYRPDFSCQGDMLKWSMTIPHWEEDSELNHLLYQTWWLATFFNELCPTRPILALKGEKGSGKSMVSRINLRLMFGPAVDVYGVPEKADAFTSLISSSHIIVLDNMDDVNREIRDKIASISTGKIDKIRRLYTTNESQTIRYRCWLAITSRTPDTLQRDDLIDRTLILPVQRINDNDRTRESLFLTEVLKRRNGWWGDILSVLNSIVHEIRRAGIPDRAGLRMEDWAALGSVIARICGQGHVWEYGIEKVKQRQAEFLLDDNVLLQGIEAWLSDPISITNTSVNTRDLYQQLKSALYGLGRPDANWPKSVKSFGRLLAGMRRELQEHLAKSSIQMSWVEIGKRTYYRFDV